MTDREKLREKLIELVGQVQDCGCDVTDVVGMKYVENNVLIDHLIANGVTVQEWIPVTERLPNEKGEYLVAFHPCWWDDVKWDKFCVGTDTFRGKTAWAKKKFQRVTHWMPLPEPPKGD